ncbi:ATPase inhibitor [Friedmanniomyces endolithicus]|nr:ATPase inhibitor [Friedmanniomyces endolithicus]
MSITRTLLTRQLPALAARTTTRSFKATQGDAFTKREQASEDYYVRQQEKDKLAKLKQKIADQEAQLAKDREEAESMVKKP